MENGENDYIGHVIIIAIILRYDKDNRDGVMALCVKVSTSKPSGLSWIPEPTVKKENQFLKVSLHTHIPYSI